MTCMIVACKEASSLGDDLESLLDDVETNKKFVVRGKSKVIRKAYRSIEEMDILVNVVARNYHSQSSLR